jgi:hypothetical protein
MCLITAAPKGTIKTVEALESFIRQGMSSNTDGSGISYKRNGTNIVHLKKGLFTVSDVLTEIERINLDVNDELVIHHRIGTSGEKDAINTHPFLVTTDKELSIRVDGSFNLPTMAHNGVFYKFTDRQSKYSDTYHFIEKFISNNNVLNILKEDFTQFDDWFSSVLGSAKLAFLFPDRDMLLIGKFTEDDGYFHSNSGYKSYVYDKGGSSSFSGSCGWGGRSGLKDNHGNQLNFDDVDFNKKWTWDVETMKYKWNESYNKIIHLPSAVVTQQKPSPVTNNLLINGKYLNLTYKNYSKFLFIAAKDNIGDYGVFEKNKPYELVDYQSSTIVNRIKRVGNDPSFKEHYINMEANIKDFRVYVKAHHRTEFSGLFNISKHIEANGPTLSLMKNMKKALARNTVGSSLLFKDYGIIEWSNLNYIYKQLESELDKRLSSVAD